MKPRVLPAVAARRVSANPTRATATSDPEKTMMTSLGEGGKMFSMKAIAKTAHRTRRGLRVCKKVKMSFTENLFREWK
jgi:hypothetical protein